MNGYDNEYDRVRMAFARGIIGAFVTKEHQEDIDRLVNDGIAVIAADYGDFVKVVKNEDK